VALQLLIELAAIISLREGSSHFGGQYRKENLIAQFGAYVALPDLRHEIARCERRGKIGDACAVHYVALFLSGADEIAIKGKRDN